ncbi:MAG: hypothetical protein FD123_4102 [Bacteroidetes bacterium]|nr:MAG: hypothetical protein FD123_4102 [Bacteroidota bacterium]
MPVEIRELLIKTTVEGSGPVKEGANPAAEGGSAPKTGGDKTEQNKMKDRLLKECLNLVMDNFSSITKER